MIEVSQLQKRFRLPRRKHKPSDDPREFDGYFHAVRDVSFQVAAGEVLGLLGPNGAGKTTTLRMLSTAIAPSQGRIQVDGVDLVADPLAARGRIGFLSGATGLYGRLTVAENIRYFGQAYGVPEAELAPRIAGLLERLDMLSYADRRVDALSAGMKQRAAIARTVIHAPRVLVLDEPTTGLDILGAEVVLDFMRDCLQQGVALVFSTHQLHEVEALCQRVCIINQGISRYQGSVAALREAGQGDLARGYLQQLEIVKPTPAAVDGEAAAVVALAGQEG
ncbi:ABC transporter ATP-binding protein [Chitinimonas sp.]|uniref:ABC transporter ATP-binding protein n=1 Tax=Chitinimonas sp. TaxID=1934313 RepID=UPI002F94A069